MNDSLQLWCVASVELAKRHPSIRGGHSGSPELERLAEQVIETVAFRKLAACRGIDASQVIGASNQFRGETEKFCLTLVEACPLVEESPVEALGLIHEQFVAQRGSSASNSVRRRSKTRKTNGVVYTPTLITEYIANQTLGLRLEGLTPIEAESLTVLDPAMGSGAFLLAAYRYLLDWNLKWFTQHEPKKWSSDVKRTKQGWKLTFQRSQSILRNNLFGVDLDADAIEVASRSLWLTLCEHSSEAVSPDMAKAAWKKIGSNLKAGHSLIGNAFGESYVENDSPISKPWFSWADQFPQVAVRGGFEIVIGNPPYRREKNSKHDLDEIGATPLVRYRSPRMDLWYYFVHRCIDLLRKRGTLSFITNAYWLNGTGAQKMIEVFRDQVHLDELFLLRNQIVFPGVSGHHVIFRLTKMSSQRATTIKIASSHSAESLSLGNLNLTTPRTFVKNREQLFCDGKMNVGPPANEVLDKLSRFPRLIELGIVRQGIAENPSTINRRTVERFHGDASNTDWILGEGVFSLRIEEVQRLCLHEHETGLLRPYHDLCDLGRYWSATDPSRRLIYSTRDTCPEIAECPALQRHLARFRAILVARRETRTGSNRWWHLHWPRDERIWQANKLIVPQMALRPSFVPTFEPTYVPFSANVFVPSPGIHEDLRYLCALLNSRVLWAWFTHHAKHRGIGLELNGHVIEQAPMRRIDFADPEDVRRHDALVELVDVRMKLERQRFEGKSRESEEIVSTIAAAESQLDAMVDSLYGLDSADVERADDITSGGIG